MNNKKETKKAEFVMNEKGSVIVGKNEAFRERFGSVAADMDTKLKWRLRRAYIVGFVQAGIMMTVVVYIVYSVFGAGYLV